MNWLCVHTDATVVISLMVTAVGGFAPTTSISVMAGLSPPALLVAGVPPFATKYRVASLGGSAVAAIVKRPSAPVRARPSCAGAPAVAAHSVTVEFAIGSPPLRTWPLRLAAAKADTADIEL